MRLVILGPKPLPMRFDNRTTNRQSHAHSVLFRREKWLEYSFGKYDALAAVADLDLNRIDIAPNAQPDGLVISDRIHRVHAVADKVDQHLLNLNAVERERRQPFFSIDLDPDV